ncbi:MAG: serine hydrolase [Peptoniphilus sp.]|nr:serine hydrolase [Peptoniphilus sp.]
MTIKKLSVLLIFVTVFLMGLSSLVQGANFEDLSREVDDFIEERKEGTASVSLGIFKGGQVLSKTQHGYIDEENNIPAEEKSIYEWGSVSKVLVWISLMQLEEEGKINLDEDVKTYLPQEFSKELKYPHPLTLKNIMNLQSGFQEVDIKVEFEEGEEIPELQDLLLASEPKQIYEPGTVVAYNNWTPALGAYIVENISGQKFYDYVQEHIFTPLNMKNTAVAADWRDNAFVKDNRSKSKSYYYTEDSHESLGPCILHIGLYPAGATAGTFDDFLTFAKEFTVEHPKFFKEAQTFERMMGASLLFADGQPRIHHGLLSMDDAVHLVGHSGNTQGFTSSLWFDPTDKIGYAVMTNEPGETAYNYGLAQFLFGSGDRREEGGEDISGLYTSQRTIDQGPLRFIKYLSGILPISATEKQGIFKVPLAGMTISYQGGNRYRFDNGNGLAYQVVERKGGILENFTTDSQALGTFEGAMAYALIAGALFLLLAMIIRLVRRIISKLRKRENKISPSFISHVAGSVISFAFIYLWLLASSYSKVKIAIVSLICIGATLVICWNFLSQLLEKIHGKGKGLGAVTWQLFMVVFVIFFQLYKFWG